jgi:hypothetical protein
MSAVPHPIALAGRGVSPRASGMIMAGFSAFRYPGSPAPGRVRAETTAASALECRRCHDLTIDDIRGAVPFRFRDRRLGAQLDGDKTHCHAGNSSLDDGYSHRYRHLGATHHARHQQAVEHSQTERSPGHTGDFAVPHGRFLGADDGGLEVRPGRSIVLGYTTPLWVAPGAWLLLKEDLSARQVVGIVIGLTGFAIMFNPAAFDWPRREAVLGNGLLLLSALAWSVSILYTRAHHWIAAPFQLVFWQALLATFLLTILALIIEGELHIVWSNTLGIWFAYSGVVGTALGFWAMTVVGRRVSATTTSLGILATPVIGIVSSAAFLGEQVDQALLIAATMIIVGIGIGTSSRSS